MPALSPHVQQNSAAVEFLTPERCWIVESWSSADDPAVSVARARVEPGVLTQLHRLNGVDERYVFVHGKGEVEVDGQAPQMVQVGDVAVIPRGVSQRIRNIGDNDLIFYCVCSPPFTPDCYENLEDIAAT